VAIRSAIVRGMMRIASSVLAVVVLASAERADCPPDCLPGGGPKATDCYLQWTGIASMAPAPCADGAACDADGAADGACTFPLQACVGVPSADGCVPAPLTGAPTVKPSADAVAQSLAAALGGLGSSGCTPVALRVPLKVSRKGVKTAVARLKVTASAGARRDTDKLRLACIPRPGGPSFAADVQPIFTEKCAYCGCHSGTPIPGLTAPTLEAGVSYAAIVGQPVPRLPRKTLVQPRAVKKSYLAAKILGEGIVGLMMPNGCPNLPPRDVCGVADGGCLDDAQRYTILHWIQSGALDN
jgi:hypothetical protein